MIRASLILATALLAACTKGYSALDGTSPEQPLQNQKNGGDSATSPTANSGSSTQPAATTACLSAATPQATRGAACSVQGRFAFIDFEGSDLNQVSTMKIRVFSSSGAVIGEAQNPTITPSSRGSKIVFTDQKGELVRFEGANLSSSPPTFGYSVVVGNSGFCAPASSGTPQTCNDVVARQNGDSDNFRIPEIDITPKVTFLYSHVPGQSSGDATFPRFYAQQVSYDSALSYCRNLNARLPTVREIAIELSNVTSQGCFKPSAYEGKASSDPAVIAESMGLRGYQAIYKSHGSGLIDFYFKSACEFRDPRLSSFGSMWTGSTYEPGNQVYVLENNYDFSPTPVTSVERAFVCVVDRK